MLDACGNKRNALEMKVSNRLRRGNLGRWSVGLPGSGLFGFRPEGKHRVELIRRGDTQDAERIGELCIDTLPCGDYAGKSSAGRTGAMKARACGLSYQAAKRLNRKALALLAFYVSP